MYPFKVVQQIDQDLARIYPVSTTPLKTASMFCLSGTLAGGLGTVLGTFLEDVWAGRWDMFGTCWGGIVRGVCIILGRVFRG